MPTPPRTSLFMVGEETAEQRIGLCFNLPPVVTFGEIRSCIVTDPQGRKLSAVNVLAHHGSQEVALRLIVSLYDPSQDVQREVVDALEWAAAVLTEARARADIANRHDVMWHDDPAPKGAAS